MKQKALFLFLICSVLLMVSTPAFAGDVQLMFNGKTLRGDVEPFIESGRTMVPLRMIAESLGADVQWDGSTRTIILDKKGKIINLTLDSKVVYINGEKGQELDVPAKSINGRTMVPVRFITETLGAGVGWDPDNRTVIINYKEIRDGMLPEELYVKSTKALEDAKEYNFSGDGSFKITTNGQEMNTAVSFEGAFKAPAEMYMKETVSMKNDLINSDVIMEMYIDDQMQVYTNVMGQGWQKIETGLNSEALNSNLLNNFGGLENQDPAAMLQQIDEFGLIFSHGNEAVIDGRDYYVLNVRLDQEKYIDKMMNVMDQIDYPSNTNEIPTDEAEMQKARQMIQTLMKSIKTDISYKMYIDKETFYMTKIDVNFYINMDAEGLSQLPEELSATMKPFKMYMNYLMDLDFESDVKMPEIDIN